MEIYGHELNETSAHSDAYYTPVVTSRFRLLRVAVFFGLFFLRVFRKRVCGISIGRDCDLKEFISESDRGFSVDDTRDFAGVIETCDAFRTMTGSKVIGSIMSRSVNCDGTSFISAILNAIMSLRSIIPPFFFSWADIYYKI